MKKPLMEKMVVTEANFSTGIISKYDVVHSKRPGWKSKQKSLTFPNRTLTLRQIADRFASGLQTIDEKVALYDDGQVVIKNFEKLDLIERQEIVKDAEARMRKVYHDRQVAAKAKHDQEFSQEVQRQVDERMKAISETKIDNV